MDDTLVLIADIEASREVEGEERESLQLLGLEVAWHQRGGGGPAGVQYGPADRTAGTHFCILICAVELVCRYRIYLGSQGSCTLSGF